MRKGLSDDSWEGKKLPFFDQFFIRHSVRLCTYAASLTLLTKPLSEYWHYSFTGEEPKGERPEESVLVTI